MANMNDNQTDISYRLAQAVSTGRERNGRPENREAVLKRLLVKRAAAHRAGLTELEAIMLRQIQWSLPVQHGEKTADLAA